MRRKRLLRGVFADNMRLLGKEPVGVLEGLRIRPLALGMLVFLFAFWIVDTAGTSGVRGTALDSERGITPEPPHPEYSALVGDSLVSLKKLFGLEIKTIMIDAGHGGEDPGAIGRLGTEEKDITIDIAKRLRTRLMRHSKYDILMTRKGDRTVSLKKRVDLSNKKGADLFVSIHVNYLPRDENKEIIETYYFGPPQGEDTLKLAEIENRGSEFSFSDYNSIVRKLNYTFKLQESRLFAASIHDNLYTNMHSRNKQVLDFGVKRAPFVVLMGADAPGVLVEVTCLSNRDEERRLGRAWYRDEIARYIEQGIVKYLNSRSDT